MTNTVVSSADFNAGVRDNLNWLRGFVPDPAGNNRVLVAQGTTSAAWTSMTDPTILTAVKAPAATTIVTNFTALTAANKNGMHEVNPGTGGPTGSGTWYAINVVEANQPTNYSLQIAVDINDQNASYLHTTRAGTPDAWVKLWHAGNDGSGSGLDADTLDGVQLSAINQVPSGLIAAVATAAGIPAGWTRYTNADGRLLIGAGTTFSQTFTENTAAGTGNWTPSSGLTVAGIAALADSNTFLVNLGTNTAVATSAHTHPAPALNGSATAWIPPVRVVVHIIKS